MSAKAAVIIPTYGHAPFLRHALESARRQTVTELEICVIFDGSPPEMVDMIRSVAEEDSRIRVFVNPKAPRTGEIHRPEAIALTEAPVICYLCHDDLYLSNHVAAVTRMLQKADFVHTLHCYMGMRENRFVPSDFLYADLELFEYKGAMLNPRLNRNFFGLTFGAHTRRAYYRLEEGWTTAPDGIWTDFHMWRKFLSAPWCICKSHLGVTALNFPKNLWSGLMTGDEFEDELEAYLPKLDDPDFLQDLNSAALKHLLRMTFPQI